MSATKSHRILQAETLIDEKQLDQMLEDGWELIQIVQTGASFYFYFREVEQPAED